MNKFEPCKLDQSYICKMWCSETGYITMVWAGFYVAKTSWELKLLTDLMIMP